MRVRFVSFGAARAQPDADVVGTGRTGSTAEVGPVTAGTVSVAVAPPVAVPTPVPAPATPAQPGANELAEETRRQRAARAAAIQAALEAQRAEEARRLAEEGEWEKWCRANAKDKYNGELSVCMRNFPGGALVPGAPWTQAGMAARWIAATNKADYEDIERLFVIAWTDPVQFWKMVFAATFVIPVLGPAYVLSMQTPVGIAKAIGDSFARGEQIKRGSGWQRVWDKLLYPIWQKNSSLVWDIIKYGPSPAALVVFLLKREATNERYPAEVKAMMLALADSADLVDVLADPKRITEPGTISKIGSTLVRVASVFEQNAPAVAGTVRGLGRAMELNAVPISILMKRGPAGAAEALDEFGGRILGVRPSVIQTRGIDAVRAAAAPNADLLRSMKEIERAINALGAAIDGIRWKELQAVLAGPVRFVRELMAGQIKSIEDLMRALSAPPTAPAPAVQPRLPAPQPQPPVRTPGPVPVTPIAVEPEIVAPVAVAPAAPAGQSVVVLAVAGAGAGLLVGGPIGAGVGGVLGLLLGRGKGG